MEEESAIQYNLSIPREDRPLLVALTEVELLLAAQAPLVLSVDCVMELVERSVWYILAMPHRQNGVANVIRLLEQAISIRNVTSAEARDGQNKSADIVIT